MDPWVQQREDLRPILETARDTISLFEMGSALAACDVPQEILRAIRTERLPRQMEVCEEMLSAQTWSSKCPSSQKPPAPFLCRVRTADEPGPSALPLLSNPHRSKRHFISIDGTAARGFPFRKSAPAQRIGGCGRRTHASAHHQVLSQATFRATCGRTTSAKKRTKRALEQ